MFDNRGVIYHTLFMKVLIKEVQREIVTRRIVDLYECRCGKRVAVRRSSVSSGATRSCGCIRSEALKGKKGPLKHGDCKSVEYRAWSSMKSRCSGTNKKHRDYKNYFLKGITICDRWKNSYENFLKDMGRKPSKDLSIDRIDNSKGYFPGNCRWADIITQNNNRF